MDKTIESILEKILDLGEKNAEISTRLKPTEDFNGLGGDIQKLELVQDIETHYKLEISDKKYHEIQTPNDMAMYVFDQLHSKQ